jgi:hypothetical protein
MRLALPFPHYTVADVWAMLPPNRRDLAQEYVEADRVGDRYRTPTGYLARIFGYRDAWVAEAALDPDGWSGTCSCHSGRPCSHLGALLWDASRNGSAYRPWPSSPWPADAVMLRWARGDPFPWSVVAELGNAPWPPDQPEWRRFGPSQRSAALRRWMEQAPAGSNGAGPASRVNPLLKSPELAGLDCTERVHWIQLLEQHPDLDLTPMLGAGPCDAAVEAQLLQNLYRMAGQHALDPRPSQALVARALLEHLADFLAAHGRRGDVDAWWRRFSFADPSGIGFGDWLYRHGDTEAAAGWWRRIAPQNSAQAAALADRLKLVRAGDASDGEPASAPESGPASPPDAPPPP